MKNENLVATNQVTLAGELSCPFEFDHETHKEKFYRTTLKTTRLSEIEDTINLIISERLVDVSTDPTGALVMIKGQFRSYNKHYDDGRVSLILYVFVHDIEQVEYLPEPEDCNYIRLEGTICKEPNMRKTPLGKVITDLLIAVNRPYGKSDYIPAIAWKGIARDIGKKDIGDKIVVHGRIQSRDYNKMLDSGEVVVRTAYEVSIFKYEDVQSEDEAEEQVQEGA